MSLFWCSRPRWSLFREGCSRAWSTPSRKPGVSRSIRGFTPSRTRTNNYTFRIISARLSWRLSVSVYGATIPVAKLNRSFRRKEFVMKFGFPKARRFFKDFAAQSKEKENDTLAIIGRFRLRCNLCGRAFKANSRVFRFCKLCKTEDEILQFAAWLQT